MARLIIIPARLASERFPRKLLQDETGWPLIRHVHERCRQVSGTVRVVVAVDGNELADTVRAFGGEFVQTDPALPSGSDRVAAAARALGVDVQRDLIVNVQGDEPEIDPEHIAQVFELLATHEDADVATLAVPRADAAGFADPHRVKVVCALDGRALYFSRAPIPLARDAPLDTAPRWLLHVGLYGYRPIALMRATATPPTPLERTERLEQLRFLEMGLRIQVGIADSAAAGVDTPADYRRFVAAFRAQLRNSSIRDPGR